MTTTVKYISAISPPGRVEEEFFGPGREAGPPPAWMLDLERVAIDAAEQAGLMLLDRQAGIRQADTKSSPTDPVTEADRASEQLIVGLITARRPQDAIVGEEGTVIEGTSGLRWVIDPLDGTVSYLYQRPAWCVSVAVEDDRGAIAGAIFDPNHGELFHAIRGYGSYVNDQRLRVNEPVPPALALVGTGFSYSSASRQRQADVLGTLLPLVRDIRRSGSCASDLCALAAGRLDAFFEDELSPWDWAAGALIAREAGARATLLRASTPKPGLLAAGPSLHEELSLLLARAHEAAPVRRGLRRFFRW